MQTVKVVVAGDANVGKTALIRRFAKGRFSPVRRLTLGMDVTLQTVTLHGGPMRLALWDISPQAADRRACYDDAQAILLVYDVTEPGSVRSLTTWCERCRRLAPGVPLVVVGNKDDLPGGLPDAIEGKLTSFLAVEGHIRVSALSGEHVKAAFAMAVELASRNTPVSA